MGVNSASAGGASLLGVVGACPPRVFETWKLGPSIFSIFREILLTSKIHLDQV